MKYAMGERCDYCRRRIHKIRLPERVNGRSFMWATVRGNRFYCINGPDSQHGKKWKPAK